MSSLVGRRGILKKSLTLLAFSVIPVYEAKAASLVAVRMWPAEEYTRLTIEHDQPIKFRYFGHAKVKTRSHGG